jgi:transcriptional repressor NrdR
MVCVQCGAETRVVNSRLKKRLNVIWRRRVCNSCGAIFTTEENTDYALAWVVKDARGKMKPFSRDKLFLSLYKACGHRKTAITDAGAIADTVMATLVNNHLVNARLDTDQIRNACLIALNRFDKAAFSSYKAFH